MDMQKDKNNKRFGIKGVIVSISAVPVLIVGIIVTIFASLTMRAGVERIKRNCNFRRICAGYH